MNKLLKELRENQKLRKINVIFSPAVPKDNFPHPVSSEQLAKVLKGAYWTFLYCFPFSYRSSNLAKLSLLLALKSDSEE